MICPKPVPLELLPAPFDWSNFDRSEVQLNKRLDTFQRAPWPVCHTQRGPQTSSNDARGARISL